MPLFTRKWPVASATLGESRVQKMKTSLTKAISKSTCYICKLNGDKNRLGRK